ncbi:aldehyde dehydrogenase family protein, partial [Nocardia neocaledoniensis]|uniref:aldehyde dehydrogenase family protein n=1 Tax=Nocardia neocaledoniensis TaxID=236511 RepID=UPI00313BE135
MNSAVDIPAVLRSVRIAHPTWAATAPAERASTVRAAAAAVRARADDLAVTLEKETGRPRASGREGVLAGAATLEQYAELGPLHRGRSLQGSPEATDLMIPEPRGVVLALTPWNDPVAIACGLLGAALVTGNTVLHKPSERCPRTGELLGEILARHLPDDTLRTVTGDGQTGALLAAAPEVAVIAHVGGSKTGRHLAAVGALRGAKVLLENGGNDPLLVDAGVDPGWGGAAAAPRGRGPPGRGIHPRGPAGGRSRPRRGSLRRHPARFGVERAVGSVAARAGHRPHRRIAQIHRPRPAARH